MTPADGPADAGGRAPAAMPLVELVGVSGRFVKTLDTAARIGNLLGVGLQLNRVGLDPTLMRRFPHQFSGGQRSRIGIARALAVKPEFLVCDESVAALDVSIQAQVLNLFMDLRSALDLTYLYISHDRGVVEHISNRVAIMYLGRVVESGPAGEIFAAPRHPYTQALLKEVGKVVPGKRTFCRSRARSRCRWTRRPAATSTRAARRCCRAAVSRRRCCASARRSGAARVTSTTRPASARRRAGLAHPRRACRDRAVHSGPATARRPPPPRRARLRPNWPSQLARPLDLFLGR